MPYSDFNSTRALKHHNAQAKQQPNANKVKPQQEMYAATNTNAKHTAAEPADTTAAKLQTFPNTQSQGNTSGLLANKTKESSSKLSFTKRSSDVRNLSGSLCGPKHPAAAAQVTPASGFR